ncbi:MAG: hypothetical protein KDB14_28565, partial [Planctomycetales bacterium]|nr:hypothetical protein [Planctomycetales bacterium]
MTDLQPLWEAFRADDPETSLKAGSALVAAGAKMEQVLPAMIDALQLTPIEPSGLWPFVAFPWYATLAFFDFEKPAVREMAIRALDHELPAERRINLIRFISCRHGVREIVSSFLQRLVDNPVEDATLRAWAEVVVHGRHKHDLKLTENAIRLADRDDVEAPLRVRILDCLSRSKPDDVNPERLKAILLASLCSEHEKVAVVAGNSLACFELLPAEWDRVYAALDGRFGYAALPVLLNQPQPPAAITVSVMKWLSRDWEQRNELAQTVLARIGSPAVRPCLELAADAEASNNSRSGALWSLWRMKALDKAAKTHLRGLVESAGYGISSQAAAVLIRFGDTSDRSIGPHKGRLRWRPDQSTGPHK